MSDFDETIVAPFGAICILLFLFVWTALDYLGANTEISHRALELSTSFVPVSVFLMWILQWQLALSMQIAILCWFWFDPLISIACGGCDPYARIHASLFYDKEGFWWFNRQLLMPYETRWWTTPLLKWVGAIAFVCTLCIKTLARVWRY